MYFALLDVLRFFSAFGVLSSHVFGFRDGRLGVYLFFIISGFVIYFSLGKGIKEYSIGRFLRLYPLFWFCCTLTYLVTVIYDVNLPIKQYFISMLLFNDGKIASMVDGSYWTLTFELLFYIYVGVFVWLFSVKRLEWFYVSWLLVAFLSFYFKLDQIFFFKLLSVRFAPYFVFGGMLALLVDRYKTSSFIDKARQISILFASTLLPLFISRQLHIASQGGGITNSTGIFDLKEIIVIELFFILVVAAVTFSRHTIFLNTKIKMVCVVLGGITYPLYLLHSKISEVIIKHQGLTYGEINTFSVTWTVFVIVISYYISMYEVPIRKLIKRKLFRV